MVCSMWSNVCGVACLVMREKVRYELSGVGLYISKYISVSLPRRGGNGANDITAQGLTDSISGCCTFVSCTGVTECNLKA